MPEINEHRRIGQFGDGYVIMSDSQDMQAVFDSIGYQNMTMDEYDNPQWDYGCVIVKVGDGEYLEVWATESSVPYVWSIADRLL